MFVSMTCVGGPGSGRVIEVSDAWGPIVQVTERLGLGRPLFGGEEERTVAEVSVAKYRIEPFNFSGETTIKILVHEDMTTEDAFLHMLDCTQLVGQRS